MNKIKVAVIGTVGVPAIYGGFETLVENIIGSNCSEDVEYTVFCSSKSYDHKIDEYRGAKLKYVGLKANGIQSIMYDIVSLLRSFMKYDVLLILGVSGAIVLPFIKFMCKGKVIVNIDGLEHRRDKWSSPVRRFLKFSEKIAVRYADVVVADNKGIQDYVQSEYRGRESTLIAYGGDHVVCDTSAVEQDILRKYGLTKGSYAMALCRIEPENNVHIIIDAFVGSPLQLIFVGNWDNSDYGRDLRTRMSLNDNIQLLSPIYDLPTLNVLRSNCSFYLHGHSAGGTNPSLVEAMFFGRPIFAYNCVYNRYSTEGQAFYFTDSKELVQLQSKSDEEFTHNAMSMLEISSRKYLWSTIAMQYESLYK